MCSMPKKPFIETQHAEESEATADIPKSLDASKPTEEVVYQPNTAAIEKGYLRPNKESVLVRSCPISSIHLESAPGSDTFRFLKPDVDPENSRLCKDLQHPTNESQTQRVPELHSASRVTKSQNKKNPMVLTFKGTESSPSVFLGHHTIDPSLFIEKAESDLESIPDDEITSISGDDDELVDSEKELSVADEVEADKVLDKILTEINTEDTTTLVFVTPSTDVSYVSNSKSHVLPMVNIQELAARALWKKKKNSSSDLSGHLLKRMYLFTTHVHNLGKFLPSQFADKMDSVVPRMVVDALKERLSELLTNYLKN
ncbi:hypothetical protein Tco_1319268 [Tanacetum coccineum]